jgi:geranylgeranyl reductase family protein
MVNTLDADVVVAGTGPAGSTAAYVAAKGGLQTVLMEKRGPPRDKTCGGLLTRACVEHVRSIYGTGVPWEVQVSPSPLPTFVVPPSGLRHGFLVSHEDVLSVTRRKFDSWLADRAVQAGAALLSDEALLGYRQEGDHLVARTTGREGARTIRTRHLVGADGVYSAVRAQLRPRPHRDRAYYIQEYHPRIGGLEDMFYLLYRGDVSPIYAYAMPKDDVLCMGIGIHKSVPPTFETGMTRLKEWLAKDFGFEDRGVLRREGYSVPFGNVVFGEGPILLAGDAAGFCYPPTGEGITFAVQSGAEAAVAILQGEEALVDRYASRMRKVAKAVEAAAARTLVLTDDERERRIEAKARLGPLALSQPLSEGP